MSTSRTGRIRNALGRIASGGSLAVGRVLSTVRRHQDVVLVLAILAGIGIMVLHWTR
jgi:hypothetical protein